LIFILIFVVKLKCRDYKGDGDCFPLHLIKKTEEGILESLVVIPLLQEYNTVLSRSNVRGLNLTPSGDLYLKYINIQ